MRKLVLLAVAVVTVLVLSACGEEVSPCGEGTTLVGNECVLDENVNPNPTAVSCSNETGLHSVPGAKMYTISSWLNWRFIGGHLVTDPDNAWIQTYGAAVFNVHTVPSDPWMGSFTNSGLFLTEGCEYTFEFTLRTEAPNIKGSVIVFGESTSGITFFEEEAQLTELSTTYRYTVVPNASDWASTGVYFANSTGMVIIEGVQVERNPIGTNSGN